VEKMATWLTDAAPRSRIDAYPLWVLTRDILKRFLGKELSIVSREAKRMATSLDMTNKALRKVQHDLGKSQKEVADRDEKLKKLPDLVDKISSLEEQLKAMEQKYTESESKVSMLLRKIDEQKELFSKKIEETKASVKEKCDAANEKRIEAFQQQLSDYQKNLQKSSEELKAARAAVAEAERKSKKQKEEFDNQLKSEKERPFALADVLKAIETMDGKDSCELFKTLVTGHKEGCARTEGSFLRNLHELHKQEKPEIYDLPEGVEPEAHEKTPLLRLMAKHNLYGQGIFNRREYKIMNDSHRWDLFIALMSGEEMFCA
jgi:myosin heavy subunit